MTRWGRGRGLVSGECGHRGWEGHLLATLKVRVRVRAGAVFVKTKTKTKKKSFNYLESPHFKSMGIFLLYVTTKAFKKFGL